MEKRKASHPQDQLSIFGVHHIAFRTPVLRQVSVRKLNPLTYIKLYLKKEKKMDAAFDVFICSVVAPVAADEYPVAGPCPLQGMVDLAFEDKEAIRTAFCLLSTLVATFHRIAKDCNAPAFARFLEDTRSVFAMLAPASLGSVAWPSPGQLFVLTPCASVSHEDWLIFLNSDDTRRCEIDWGPSPQSVRDLLAPAAACLYTWMGNAFAPPTPDLLYCFTASPTSFVSCWTPCPADASFLDKPAVVKRVTQLRTRGDLDSPGPLACRSVATRRENRPATPSIALYGIFSSTGVSIDIF